VAAGLADRLEIARLLGHEPRGEFEVLVRDASGVPLVIQNAPLLFDGTPMPTRYWLVGKEAREAVSRLESAGGGRRIEELVDRGELTAAHARYAEERDMHLPAGHSGPRPHGGVGGTRQGVKCLHAHLAWFLAGGDDPVGRRVAKELAGAPVAAIDCGTNSTRLFVAAPWPAGGGVVALAREMRITRLGQGVDASGELQPEAIERVVSVLSAYRQEMDELEPGAVRAVATSALRDAVNGEAFLDRAEDVLGVRPEVLAGDEEGRLSFAGATSSLPTADGPYLVVDVGGGSTELIAGDPAGEVGEAVSLDIGCVRVTERYLSAEDPPAESALARVRAELGELLDATCVAHPSLLGERKMVGLAGTVSALASIEQRLEHYDRSRLHHHRLRRDTVEAQLRQLAGMTIEERRHVPGLEVARAEVIVGGAVVLAEVMSRFGAEELLTSESDILDGIAAALMAGHAHGAPGHQAGS
jgi:exopolyphosphatase/guanosine-5'-triphosphate,3'-diphosphate pyrophosphatase